MSYLVPVGVSASNSSTDAPYGPRGGSGLSDVPYLNTPENPGSDKSPNLVKSNSRFVPDRHLTPVCGIEVYASSVLVKREPATRPQAAAWKRGVVRALSSRSLARLAFTAFNTPADFRSIITLTYPRKFSNDGKAAKTDLNKVLTWLRRNYPGLEYLWFLEFQKRGAVHFHILVSVDLAEQGKIETVRRKNGKHWQTHKPTWRKLEQYWRKIGGGLTSWEAVREPNGGKRYAAKYATKPHQKQVPEAYQNVGRFWGNSRGVKPKPIAFYRCDESELRQALKAGGWKYVPPEGAMMHKELYQAADKLQTAHLLPVDDLAPWDDDVRLLWDVVGALDEVGVYPKFVDRPGRAVAARVNEYQCVACGELTGKWVGQCPSCESWHTVKGFELLPEPQEQKADVGVQRVWLDRH